MTTGEPTLNAPDDPTAFGDWVRPHMGTLARIVARLAPDADRDDVVQDVLARAWAKREQFDPKLGTPGAWLYAIAADQAVKARRRLSRAVATRTELPAGMAIASPSGGAERSALRLDVERALARLSARQRMAVACVYFIGLSIADTATVMGCASGTVKSTLADARARLRMMLEVSE